MKTVDAIAQDPAPRRSHGKYGTRDIGGRYAEMGRATGTATEGGQAALLEFINQPGDFSSRGVLR